MTIKHMSVIVTNSIDVLRTDYGCNVVGLQIWMEIFCISMRNCEPVYPLVNQVATRKIQFAILVHLLLLQRQPLQLLLPVLRQNKWNVIGRTVYLKIVTYMLGHQIYQKSRNLQIAGMLQDTMKVSFYGVFSNGILHRFCTCATPSRVFFSVYRAHYFLKALLF